MPTYTSSKVASTIQARDGIGVVHQVSQITIGTALLVNDIVQLFKIPEGAIVLDLKVSSNGTQSGSDSVVTIGDTLDTDRYVTTAGGLILRSGGGIVAINAHTGLNFQYASETTIDLLVTTVGTGQTTGGVIKASIIYAPEA